MKPFLAADLHLHCSLSGCRGSSAHPRLVWKNSIAKKASDRYEGTLWGLRLDDEDARPRQLTSAVFDASSPLLDSTGKRLAFLSSRDDGGKQVQLLDLDGGEARQLTMAVDVAVATIEHWSPDDARLLLGGACDFDEDGGRPGRSGAPPPRIARYLPYKQDGSGIIAGKRMHLHAASVLDGQLTPVTRGDFDVFLGRWSPDGRRLAFVRNRSERERHRRDLWLANADGSGARLHVDALASITSVAWSPDGSRIALVASEQPGDAMHGLWLVSLDDPTPRRLGGDDFEVDSLGSAHWHPDNARVAVVCSRRGLLEPAVVSTSDGGVTRLRIGLRHVTSMAPCGERIAFIAASMRWPGEVHSMRWDGGDMRRHTGFNRRWFARHARPHVKYRRFRVPDGIGHEESIGGWLLLPDGKGPFPLLVDIHGGPQSIALVDYAAHACWYALCSRGWAIVAPNAVGSGSYGVDFARRLRGRWGELDLPQYEAVIHALQEEGIADDRVVCTGESYGGFLSAWAIGHSDLFKASIVCAPVANLASHAGTSDTGYYVMPWAMGGELHDIPGRFHALSPVSWCRDAKAATLILQGEDDGRCPRGQGEELFANLIHCSTAPVELVLYPQGTHAMAITGRPSHRVDFHRRIAAWAMRWVQA